MNRRGLFQRALAAVGAAIVAKTTAPAPAKDRTGAGVAYYGVGNSLILGRQAFDIEVEAVFGDDISSGDIMRAYPDDFYLLGKSWQGWVVTDLEVFYHAVHVGETCDGWKLGVQGHRTINVRLVSNKPAKVMLAMKHPIIQALKRAGASICIQRALE